MLYIGIDVAKHKHDCFITNSDGEHLTDPFVIENSLVGFTRLYAMILSFEPKPNAENVKVGLEATGHYSNNITEFLYQKELNLFVLNPLHTNLYRKGQSLRKTKTDKSDARFITMMLMTEELKPYSPSSYHISEVKTLSRHRYRLVKQRSEFKVSYTRLIDIIFPELAGNVWATTQKSMLLTLLELPNTKAISGCHLTRFTNLIVKNSHGKYQKGKAIELRNLAANSIGSSSAALAFELQQIIRTILFLQNEIDALEKEITKLVKQLNPPILTIPGISYILTGIIASEIGNIFDFSSPAKLLAFAGMEPSTHQSGQYTSTHARMVKRGSKYLRWAIMTATRLVCMRDENFRNLRNKKLAEGKHYFVALSHVSKKLIRVIYHLMRYEEQFTAQA
jgi:transposase